jgi:ubiquinone/menaquinone biosynthesis C-methylase UbiE
MAPYQHESAVKEMKRVLEPSGRQFIAEEKICIQGGVHE